MLEMVIVLWCLGSINVLTRYNHPMFFGFSLLFITVGLRGFLRFYGGVYGFIVFICVVSGILVVFAYRIALVPSTIENEIEVQEKSTFSLAEKKFLRVLSVLARLVLVLFFRVVLSFFNFQVVLSSFESRLYVTEGWGKGIRFLGDLLFLVIVYSVRIAGKLKGALIK